MSQWYFKLRNTWWVEASAESAAFWYCRYGYPVFLGEPGLRLNDPYAWGTL